MSGRRDGKARWRGAARLAALAIVAVAATSCSVDSVLVRPIEKTSSRLGASLKRTVGYTPRLWTPRLRSPVMPASQVACRAQLKLMGVHYSEAEPIDDGRACHVDWPVRVSGLPAGVKLKPAATLDCRMALALAKWTRRKLVPSARLRYLSGVDTIHQGSSYSCRRIAGTGDWSAHSTGMAIDIMDIRLNNGRSIDVHKPGFFAFREKSLLNKVRAEACPYFNTVLGPGYNADHKNHFHFDLMQRSSGRHICK